MYLITGRGTTTSHTATAGTNNAILTVLNHLAGRPDKLITKVGQYYDPDNTTIPEEITKYADLYSLQ